MNGFAAAASAPIAIASRSGVDESVHHGVAVVVDPDGHVVDSLGDPTVPIYPRSALKPFQSNAMLQAGLDLPPRLLAVVTASHSGEQQHLDAVAEILERHDLEPGDLLNTPAYPHGADPRREAIVGRRPKTSLQQNCSGKHAGMLATCRINGWPIDSYLNLDHPLQVAIRAEITRLIGSESITHVGVDGCGAPTHVMPLVDLARATGSLMRERSDVPAAMTAHPEMVGGVDRDVTIWMDAVPGLVAKEGADGVMVVGLVDGRAGALKIADGSNRARQAATVELLRRVGVDVDGALADVAERVAVPTFGHGREVGSLRPLAWD